MIFQTNMKSAFDWTLISDFINEIWAPLEHQSSVRKKMSNPPLNFEIDHENWVENFSHALNQMQLATKSFIQCAELTFEKILHWYIFFVLFYVIRKSRKSTGLHKKHIRSNTTSHKKLWNRQLWHRKGK